MEKNPIVDAIERAELQRRRASEELRAAQDQTLRAAAKIEAL